MCDHRRTAQVPAAAADEPGSGSRALGMPC